MKFSLILCSTGNVSLVNDFLRSLHHQGASEIEVVLVDQSSEGILAECESIAPVGIKVVHVRTPRGLSLGRNRGLDYAAGDIVAFPDDDCLYPPGLLPAIEAYFWDKSHLDGLLVRHQSPTNPWIAPVRRTACELSRETALRGTISSFCIFLKAAVVRQVGKFDERLGVGCPTIFQASEENDYIFRALEEKFSLYYDPKLAVTHPYKDHPSYDEAILKRAYFYSCASGWFLRKHHLRALTLFAFIVRPLLRGGLYLLSNNLGGAKYCWVQLKGRLRGMMLYPRVDYLNPKSST